MEESSTSSSIVSHIQVYSCLLESHLRLAKISHFSSSLLPCTVSQISSSLSCSDPSFFSPPPPRVHNSMLALRKVVKRFEYKPKDARGPLLEIMRVTLPLLLNMSLQLLGEDSSEAGQVKKRRFFFFFEKSRQHRQEKKLSHSQRVSQEAHVDFRTRLRVRCV